MLPLQVAVLSRVRHPNLVTLMGCCPEASGLVYEFLPNGSLEDRLACRNNTPPLTWQARTRIIGEVCSALVFLHSAEPSPAIHGDLKPANILLDANLVSKLGDLGASRLPTMTNPGSTPYTDPEYLTTGELTARSDMYSLGIVVLRLVTGQPPLGITRKVEDALDKGEMETLVDRSAGEWPFSQAEKLMLLGLQCAEVSRRRRPERMSQVWRVVEPLAKAACVSLAAQAVAGHLFGFGGSHTPFYFICPISQVRCIFPLMTLCTITLRQATDASFHWHNVAGGYEEPSHGGRWLHLRGGGDQGVARQWARHVPDDKIGSRAQAHHPELRSSFCHRGLYATAPGEASTTIGSVKSMIISSPPGFLSSRR